MTPIIYDEISNFKDASSYPFEKRKNTLIANKNDGPHNGADMFKEGELRKIFLNVAKVCFDKKWYSDILFWRDDEPCDGEDSEQYKKIQFSREIIQKQKVFNGCILSLMVGLDSFKQVSVVKTYKILEFLGDWGGFKEFLEIILSAVGLYFSEQFLKQDIIMSTLKVK